MKAKVTANGRKICRTENPVESGSQASRSHPAKIGKLGVLRRGAYVGMEPKAGYNAQLERIQQESERLWSLIDVQDDDNACWLWTGTRMKKHGAETYGQFELGGGCGCIGAHRAVFADYNGYLPEVVRHSCDNPPCCNPGHLLGGTTVDNRRDMLERNRQVRGEKSASAKLTEAQVVELRKDLDSMNVTRIAIKYGISRKMVRLIRDGKNWTHI